MDVAAGGHAQPALQGRGQVGDDVAKHIVGYDHIKLFGIAGHVHAERVHVHVLRLNLRIFGGDDLENALPQATAKVMTLDLSDIKTFLRPCLRASSNANRMTRSTPLRVLKSSCVAISSAVPSLSTPPASTYGPSVFSRITTKSTCSGLTPLSGQSASSSSLTGRTLA